MAGTDKPRQAIPREERSRQLIEATITVLAEKGFSALTLSDVARGAGVSHGVVNFHFRTKEELLAATLQHLLARHDDMSRKVISAAGHNPRQALYDLVGADSSLEDQDIAAWMALRGEAKSRPAFRSICRKYDESFQSMLRELLAAIGVQEVRATAFAIGSMLDGVASRLLLEEINREEAREIIAVSLAAFLPDAQQAQISRPPARDRR